MRLVEKLGANLLEVWAVTLNYRVGNTMKEVGRVLYFRQFRNTDLYVATHL